MTSHNAWHFVKPDPLSTTRTEQIAWGLKESVSGGVALLSGDDSVRQAVLILLMTKRGERLMRPEYGSDLHQLLFAPNSEATANIAEYYIRTALTRWEPRIDIITLDAAPSQHHPNTLVISLTYQVRTTATVETIDLTFRLNA